MIDSGRLFLLAGEKGIDGISVTVKRSEGLSLTYYEGKVEKNETGDVTSVTVNGIVKGKKAVYSLEDPDMDEEAVVDWILENASEMTGNERSEIFEGSAAYPEVPELRPDYEEIPIRRKIELLADLERSIREKDTRVRNIPELDYEESGVSIQIMNSKGLDIRKSASTCAFAAELVAEDGGESRVGYEVAMKRSFAELDFKDLADNAVFKAVSMFGASPCETGEYPVIIQNDAMTSLLSAFFSMFGGEAHLKKVSPIQGRLGQQIFSDKITVKDMPLLKGAVLREPFDDEGVACFNKTVVDRGVFTTMLHNLKTAKAFDTVSTGNGFGQSVSAKNFYIEAGERSKDELIAGTSRGLLLTEFDGLHAGLNPISGDMSLKTCGYLIEDGKIVRPVTLIVLSGNFLKMMNQVEEVGSDLKISYTGIGAPSVKFAGVSISG